MPETSERRIAIVGPAGSGKSTFARELGQRLGLPVVHLDVLYWRPGWVAPPLEEWREQVRQAAAGDSWIIDGNYSDTIDLRVARADTIIFLDLPRRTYFRRVLLRSLRFHGQVRPDSAPGCPERFDWQFLKFVWTYPAKRRPAMLRRLADAAATSEVITLRDAGEVEGYLNAIPHDNDDLVGARS